MDVQCVLIELDDADTVKSTSGILINNNFIITPSSILLEKFSKCNFPNIQPGILYKPDILLDNKVRFTIVDGVKNYREAKLAAFFKSESIRRSVEKYLLNWKTDGAANNLKEFLSTFLVLTFENKDIKVLRAQLSTLLQETANINWNVTDRICIRSSPFGNREFIGSYSEGVISNAVDEERCFIWSDCPTVFGSEGSPVFLIKGQNNHQLFGIVLSSLNWINGEWLGLTLCTTLCSILSSFSPRPLQNPIIRRKIVDVISNGVAVVKNGPTWGSAVLLDENKGIFLTNAHVIENYYELEIHWNKLKFSATVIYQVPADKNYDLALLKVDAEVLKRTQMKALKVFTGKVNIGDPVLAAGYPLYPPEINANITVTSGNISHVANTFLGTTCSILSGSSGGAVLTPEGYLVGIITSNATLTSKSADFPRINMIIPISAIWDALSDFINTGDPECLKKLAIPDDSTNIWTSLKSKL